MAAQQQVASSEGSLLSALDMVAKEKGIDRGRLVKTVEEAIPPEMLDLLSKLD